MYDYISCEMSTYGDEKIYFEIDKIWLMIMKNEFNVYVHTFPNKKRYVGLTTQNVNTRWQNGYGYRNQLVYKAILKYGWSNITHTVYKCDTEAEMKYLERYLIAYYQTTNKKYGYNITTGGESANGMVSKFRKPVDQYSKEGILIKTWESIYSIERELNYSIRNIHRCLTKKQPTAYNYYWCYSGETPVFKTRWTHNRKVLQYDLQNNFITEFESAIEAAKSLGKVCGSNITACCRKKRKSAFNYIWEYKIEKVDYNREIITKDWFLP